MSARRLRPRLTKSVDVVLDQAAFRRLTKEEQWGQALRDLRLLYESGPPGSWHAAVFTLAVHAAGTRRRLAACQQAGTSACACGRPATAGVFVHDAKDGLQLRPICDECEDRQDAGADR